MKNGGWFQKIKGRSAFRAGHTLMFLGMLFCGACAGGQRDTGGEIAQAVKAGGIINIEDTGSLTGKFPTSDVEGKTDGRRYHPMSYSRLLLHRFLKRQQRKIRVI